MKWSQSTKAGKDVSEVFRLSYLPHQKLFIPWFKNKERRKAGKDKSEAFQLSCLPH
jgi:hypothetical protein